ncbi:hypothetical protein K458DRAFT_411358 [Lentithecium fluviatile CBS 122367]|uniref:Uncharacterized protein n=1 Tax=Lentithecium fluviatile CBS 122367 TaxID=1168545 RepID=A0A6G1JM38_9PLEO|nr:hypothetical protein K458DRAFT_411358 [Lentithecium fluviatile CBS 122367]
MDPNGPGKLSRTDMAALESLRQKLMPLSYNLLELRETFMRNPNAPPDWPAIQRSIGSLSGALSSLQALLNDDPATTEVFRSLHPYPMPPFDIENPQMAGLANVILRKKPDITDEKWILDRLAKAQEFAHVPGDWNIEPRKISKDAEDVDEDDEGSKASIKSMYRRQRGTLDEDQIAELWGIAGDVVDEEMGNVGSGSGDQSVSGSEASSPEDTTMGGTEADKKVDSAGKEEQRLLPLPLEILHKFMATGIVEGPKVQQSAS